MLTLGNKVTMQKKSTKAFFFIEKSSIFREKITTMG